MAKKFGYKILGPANNSGYKILGAADEDEEQPSQEDEQQSQYEPTSATGSFLRAAGRETPEMISNLINKGGKLFSHSNFSKNLPKEAQLPEYQDVNLVPEFLRQKEGDKSHPIANFAGGLLGGLPLGGASVKAAREAVPLWKAIAERASPSFLRRSGVGTVEGAGLGSMYSKPGEESQGALLGGALGGAGYGLLPAAAKGLKNLPGRFRSVRDIDKLKSQLEQSGLSAEESNAILEKAKSESHQEHGVKSTDAISHAVNELMKEKQGVGDIPSEQPLPNEFQKMAPQVSSLLKTNAQKLAEAESRTAEHLGEGQAHGLRFGTRINELHEPVIAENKKMYDTLETNLKDKNVKIKDEKSAKERMNELYDAIKSGGFESEHVKTLGKQLDEAGKSKTIPARNFLAMYRTARDAAHDAYLESKNNSNDEARIRARKSYDELRSQAGKMHELLESSIGEEDSKILSDATKQFKEQIIPMRQNKLYRTEINPTGKVKGDILEKITGTSRGLDVIKGYVKQDPELKRLILGKMFSEKPRSLEGKNELVKPLLKDMPELSRLLQEQRAARRTHAQTESALEQAKQHDMEQGLLKEQRNKQIKTFEKNKMLEEKIASLTKTKERLNKLIKQKDISKKALAQHQIELEKAEADIKSLKRQLFKGIAGVATIMGAGKLGQAFNIF